MQFAIYCKDKDGGLEIRKSTRPAHLRYLSAHADQLVYGGPMLSADGETPVGSLLIFDCPDRRAAEAFANGDPYSKAGLFQSVEITPIRQVFPKA